MRKGRHKCRSLPQIPAATWELSVGLQKMPASTSGRLTVAAAAYIKLV